MHECDVSMSVCMYSRMYVCTYVTFTNNKELHAYTINPVYCEHKLVWKIQRTGRICNQI